LRNISVSITSFLGLLFLRMPIVAQEHVATSATPTVSAASDERPRVFITDSESWETRGSGGGSNGNWGAEMHGGARPQTAEVIKTFGDRCPQVMINNKQSIADYIVVLDHEGGKGVLRHRNKVAVFEKLSGNVVMSHSTLSLGGSVQDACEEIVKHWAQHGADLRAAAAKESATSTPVSASQTPTPSATMAAPKMTVSSTVSVRATAF